MKKPTDERIIKEQQSLHSKAFGIALLGLWGLISIRLFILQQDPMAFIDIFALIMMLSTYVLVGTIRQGNYQNTQRTMSTKLKILLTGLISTIVFAFIQIFFMDVTLETRSDTFGLIISLLIFWFVWVGLQYVFMQLSTKQADKDIDAS
jgi:hypothetical protein